MVVVMTPPAEFYNTQIDEMPLNVAYVAVIAVEGCIAPGSFALIILPFLKSSIVSGRYISLLQLVPSHPQENDIPYGCGVNGGVSDTHDLFLPTMVVESCLSWARKKLYAAGFIAWCVTLYNYMSSNLISLCECVLQVPAPPEQSPPGRSSMRWLCIFAHVSS